MLSGESQPRFQKCELSPLLASRWNRAGPRQQCHAIDDAQRTGRDRQAVERGQKRRPALALRKHLDDFLQQRRKIAGLAPTFHGSCHPRLVLGPIDLNLLGLEINLQRVVLDIVAVPGAANLLGNLLCAVAGLLDGGPLAGLLGQLQSLLNQILGLLNLGV